MPANSILIADDDEKLLSVLLSYFKDEQFTVYLARDGGEALKRLKEDHPDIMVLDIMMPGIDGFEVCRRARQFTDIPIIFLSAKDDEADRLVGLHLGADDYVVKPFSLIELTARIKANIRRARTYQALPNNSIIKIKDIEIDPHSHMVQRKGVTIDLTPIEFQILYILASHPGQAYSKERLYELIWKEPYFGNENVLNTHINRLRLKLKSNAEDSTAYVKTLWGIGYKMEEK